MVITAPIGSTAAYSLVPDRGFTDRTAFTDMWTIGTIRTTATMDLCLTVDRNSSIIFKATRPGMDRVTSVTLDMMPAESTRFPASMAVVVERRVVVDRAAAAGGVGLASS